MSEANPSSREKNSINKKCYLFPLEVLERNSQIFIGFCLITSFETALSALCSSCKSKNVRQATSYNELVIEAGILLVNF
jgi:hypothetical protein